MVDVRGDVLRPPHGTTPAAVKSNIKLEMRSFTSNENIHKKVQYCPITDLIVCKWAGSCGLCFFKRGCPVAADHRLLVYSFLFFPIMCTRTAKALYRQCGCACSPSPLLFAYVISTLLAWSVSNMCLMFFYKMPSSQNLSERRDQF